MQWFDQYRCLWGHQYSCLEGGYLEGWTHLGRGKDIEKKAMGAKSTMINVYENIIMKLTTLWIKKSRCWLFFHSEASRKAGLQSHPGIHISSPGHPASPRTLPMSETDIVSPFQFMGSGRLSVLKDEELACAHTIPACILFNEDLVTGPRLAAREAKTCPVAVRTDGQQLQFQLSGSYL